jgi:hypothetical protein
MWKKMVIGGGCVGWVKTPEGNQCAVDNCSRPAGASSKYCSKKCRVANAHARAKARKRQIKEVPSD